MNWRMVCESAGWVDDLLVGWMDEWFDGGMSSGWLGRWMNECMDGL